MKKTSRLFCTSLVAATTLLVLPSCKDDSSSAPTAAHQAKPSVSVSKRAAVYSALALLPKDVSDYVVLTDIGGNLSSLVECKGLPFLSKDILDAQLLALDNIALASTAASPATYAALAQLIKGSSLLSAGDTLRSAGLASAGGHAGAALCESLLAGGVKAMGTPGASAKPGEEWKQLHLPACYAVVTAKAGQETVLDTLYTQFLTDLQKDLEPWQQPVKDLNGFSGLRCDAAQMAAAQNQLSELEKRLSQVMAQRQFYLLARRQGNALIIAFCEDPKDIKLPTSPENSLLATGLLNPLDANLGKGMVAAAHLSKDLLTLSQSNSMGCYEEFAPAVARAFTQMSTQDAAHKESYTKAAEAMNFLGKQLQQFNRPITQPMQLQVWREEGLHLVATGDAQGASYKPGKQRLASVGEAPGTVFYAESTPSESSIKLAPLAEWLDALTHAARGISLTLPPSERTEIEAGIEIVQMLRPDVLQLVNAFSTIGSGFDGHSAVVLDSKAATLPSILSSSSGTLAEMPRLAFYAWVSDRSKLGAGWTGLLAAIGQGAEKFGADASIVNMLPITSEQKADNTTYKLDLPFFAQELVPSLTLSFKGLALGTSDHLNAELLASATGNTNLAGSVFAFRTAPLAKCLRSLAKATSSPYSSRPSELQEAAAVAALIAQAIEGVYGKASIDKGVYTLSIDIPLAK